MYELYKNFNWSLQTPGSFTLFQTQGYPFLSGCRIYADGSIKFDNGSMITIGPSSTTMGNLKISPTTFAYQTGSSSIGQIKSALNLGPGNPLAPWAVNLSVDHSFKEGSLTVGVDFVARPDNLAIVTSSIAAVTIVAVFREYTPLLYALISRIGQSPCINGQCP